MLEHPTVMNKGLPLNFFLDVEICLDNLDRVLIIKGDFCKLREL